MASLLDPLVAARNPGIRGLLDQQGTANSGLLAASISPAALQSQQAAAALQQVQQQVQNLGGGGPPGPSSSTPSAGVLPPEPGQAIPRGGFGGFLDKLFGAPNDPRLTEEQNDQIRRQAQLAAGLTLLGNEDSTASALGQAAAAGHKTAAGAQTAAIAQRDSILEEQETLRQRARDAEDRQELLRLRERNTDIQGEVQTALKDGDVEAIQEARAELSINGNFQAANALGGILDDMGVGARSSVLRLSPTKSVLVNPVTHSIEAEFETEDEVVAHTLGDRTIFREGGDKDGEILFVKWHGVSPDQQARLDAEERERVREELSSERGILNDEQQTSLNAIGDDFRMDAKLHREVAAASFALEGIPHNAASDLSLITWYTRIIDPGVSVRQSDVENAEGIGAHSAAVQRWWRRVVKGGLRQDEREMILDEARRAARAMQGAIVPIMERAQERARLSGLPEIAYNTIIFDPFERQNLEDPGGVEAARRRLGSIGEVP